MAGIKSGYPEFKRAIWPRPIIWTLGRLVIIASALSGNYTFDPPHHWAGLLFTFLALAHWACEVLRVASLRGEIFPDLQWMLLGGLSMIGGCMAYLLLAFLLAVVQTMIGVTVWEDLPHQIGSSRWLAGDTTIFWGDINVNNDTTPLSPPGLGVFLALMLGWAGCSLTLAWDTAWWREVGPYTIEIERWSGGKWKFSSEGGAHPYHLYAISAGAWRYVYSEVILLLYIYGGHLLALRGGT